MPGAWQKENPYPMLPLSCPVLLPFCLLLFEMILKTTKNNTTTTTATVGIKDRVETEQFASKETF